MSARDRAKNAILNELDLTFLEAEAKAAPTLYGTAVSTICDLACPHCMREALGIRENEFMDFDAFAARSEELKAARRVSLYGLGEPFLHPRFFDFVKLCVGLGVDVQTSTHGMSLTAEAREKAVELGLGEVNVSMDGTDKEVFEETRVGAVFETVVENVKALARLKKERGRSLPVVNINMTVMRRNLHQVPDLIRLAKSMGADSVTYSSIVIYNAQDAHKDALDTPEFERRMEEARRLSRRLSVPMSFWRQKPKGWAPDFHDPSAAYGCIFLWSNQIIERDGLMKLCCYIEEDVTNVFEHGPRAAFNSEPLLAARRALMQGRVRNECQGCMYLRERTPLSVQAKINEASKRTFTDPDLTEEDRRELVGIIADLQARKDALWPRHRYLKIDPAEGNGDAGNHEETVTAERANAAELPIY